MQFEDGNLSRRDFLGATAAGAIGASLGGQSAIAKETSAKGTGPSATAVTEFFESLSERQHAAICFPYDHPLRRKINANWKISKPYIGDDFFSDSQRHQIDAIVRSVTSDDGYKRLMKQMEDDNGGVDSYSVAMFGEPGKNFQWELTGRHVTLRADGDQVDKTGFGGPIVYGHGEEDPKANLYHYQTQKANEVFAALDTEQRKAALHGRAPKETAVSIQGPNGRFAGIAMSDLSDDQKKLVEETLKVLLSPYESNSVDEVMAILKESGGLDQLRMAFYKQGDLNNDRVWDNWRVEGPAFVWHFRGAPHVHAYVNIGMIG